MKKIERFFVSPFKWFLEVILPSSKFLGFIQIASIAEIIFVIVSILTLLSLQTQNRYLYLHFFKDSFISLIKVVWVSSCGPHISRFKLIPRYLLPCDLIYFLLEFPGSYWCCIRKLLCFIYLFFNHSSYWTVFFISTAGFWVDACVFLGIQSYRQANKGNFISFLLL